MSICNACVAALPLRGKEAVISRFRKFAVAGGTFGVALSIGFVMQNGDALAARYGTEVPLVEGASYDQPLAPVTNPPGPPAGTAGLSDVTGPPQSPATAGRTLPQLGTTPVPQMADGAEAAETQAEGDAGQADLAAAPERPSIQ